MNVHIRFLGGAGTVTGSKYLVEHEGQSLLVDCGLFQGFQAAAPAQPRPAAGDAQPHRRRAADARAPGPQRLPALAGEGRPSTARSGPRPPRRDLVQILLPDSGHIQEEDANFANRKGFSKHAPALPLYTEDDAMRSLKLLHTVPMGQAFEPLRGWTARFTGAGHILGAASLLLEVGGRRILFSGDLGRPDDLLMKPPEHAPAADVVVCESTYGDRETPGRRRAGRAGAGAAAGRGTWRNRRGAGVRCWSCAGAAACDRAAQRRAATCRIRCPSSWTAQWPCTPPACFARHLGEHTA